MMSSIGNVASRGALAGAIVSLLGGGVAGARTLSVRDEGNLRFIKSSGPDVIDEGRVRGTLPGVARVRFRYNGSPIVTASFSIASTGGTVIGHATGRLSNPNSLAPSLRGSLMLAGGTGRYAGASGRGEMYGVFNRRSYGLTFQALGTLHY